jgi:hypothetical protein
MTIKITQHIDLPPIYLCPLLSGEKSSIACNLLFTQDL